MSRLVEFLLYYKIKRLLKRFVDVMNFTTEFKRKVFALKYCRHIVRKAFSFMGRRFGLKILTIFRRDYLSFFKFEQWKRQCLFGSIALLQLQDRFSECRKF